MSDTHSPLQTPLQAPFHLSFHVTELAASRWFYGEILGCPEGRSTDTWIDFDFFGNQLSVHLGTPTPTTLTGQVDQVAVPMPHFGAVLSPERFAQIAQRLAQHPDFLLMAPMQRFEGTQGSQQTLFCKDPSGNALEFKCLQAAGALFDE